MPLPYRSGAARKVARWYSDAIGDPSFDGATTEAVTDEAGQPVLTADGQPQTRELWGTATVSLRALLDTEIDAADELASEFTAKHIVGGWVDEDGRLQREPQPIFIDAQPVTLAKQTVLMMHRYEAMQRPMPGMPPRPEGSAILTVADLVDATVRAEDFWKGFQAFAARVWREGAQGKGWAPTGSAAPASA